MRAGLCADFAESREKCSEFCNFEGVYSVRPLKSCCVAGISLDLTLDFLQGKWLAGAGNLASNISASSRYRMCSKALYYFAYSATGEAETMRAFDLDILDVRKTCRTVRDGLDRLGVLDAGEAIVATIHAAELPYPTGRIPGLVLIGIGLPGDLGRRFARLPDSATFRAKLADGTPIHGDICELDGATVGSTGAVRLLDGRLILRVELQPGDEYEHYDFSEREHHIVHLALRLIGEEDRCYRPLNEQLLPGEKCLDYTVVQQVHLPRVKKLLARIQQESDLDISKLEIEDILRRSGMQFPGKAAVSL